ncbi:hypothetical protein AVEN_252395-1 [Araneus ventricosus]|uniref:Uncharacterized protein n=1 Tax=Araneus ventricosus TaxID=182803 RepID=A0A4Y2ASQ9_ARAVE|nr:hypothetical protein AVEN_252395-1 [Araneus ventricosus]
MVKTSAAERKRKSRANQNEAKKLEVKLKSKNGMKALRLNRRGDKKIQTKEAEASKIRMRKMREKRKLESSTSQLPSTSAIPYSSPQMLGKAVRKIKKALPSSPRKKKAVVEKIASDLGLLISSHKTEKKMWTIKRYYGVCKSVLL